MSLSRKQLCRSAMKTRKSHRYNVTCRGCTTNDHEDSIDDCESVSSSPSTSCSDDSNNGSQRRLSFSPIVQVALIPDLLEYKNADIVGDIWWQRIDISDFKTELRQEFQNFLQGRELANMPVTDALKLYINEL